MTLDLHKALVEQLKPLLMEPNFEELFEQLTSNETSSTRFLLKMELNRLASKCTRNIDLRNKTELECQIFNHEGQQHYLDLPAKENFLESLALYRDEYTLGVYEQVIATHKQRILKQRNSKSLTPHENTSAFIAKSVVLGNYFSRSEERMNYSMRISVSQGQQTLNGITVDLSVGGARIRLDAKHSLKSNQPIRVKLLELSDEYYHHDLQQGVDYQIVDIEQNKEFSWLRIKRISGSDALAEMLEKLIRGYKLRYKVNVNDVLVTTKGLGFERQYLPRLPHLPLFIEKNSNIENGQIEYHISHKLLSNENQPICQYFKDEDDISQLSAFLTPDRLKRLLNSAEDSAHSQFFSFTFTAQGAKYFYSASLAELNERNLLPLFLSFASTKPSFKVFHISHQAIDHSHGYKNCILPGDMGHYSPATETQLAAFSHVLQVIDVTNPDAAEQYQNWQQCHSNDANPPSVNALKVFGQQKIAQHTIKLIALQFSERRNESRFAFKTTVLLKQGDLSTVASTDDISSRGMKLTMSQPISFNEAEPIAISYPKLQPLAGKTSLQMLPYRLLNTRKNGITLHMSALVGHTPHSGVEFLNRLLRHNTEKLKKLTENNHDVKELADGMKNIVMRQLVSLPYYLERTTKSAEISTLGIGVEQNHIANIFASQLDDTLSYDLAPLLADGKLKRDFIAPIRAMKPKSHCSYFEVFVQLSKKSQGKINAHCISDVDLKDPQEQLNFIQRSQRVGDFVALRVYRAHAGKPDLNYIRREREYLNVHAPHKTKKLEEQLWNIIGVGELLDITKEVIMRFPELYSDTTH
ncbi:pilus assembly protein PilZ [Shewanella sairae]|uniref:Pilus assembly protein PilZ n=1 Tax=Shewanella sairae TaxID=190310 RepID=A0ABQ4P7M3_9GAMM|nr:PilZ domain-containing protein [Shewanella sairae]MCL1130439.1 PilZ domain-containing protein [Shewanella sairae]GIU43537.1 pilus assembly protein PilZ [Shewanella sairae]